MSQESHDSDVAFIRALAELLNENDLTELSVKREYGQDDTLNVRVSRRGETVTTQVSTAPAAAPEPVAAAVAPPPLAEDPARHPGAVNSPMVGSVYMQAEPGAPSFVSVGQAVTEGDTLLIIEAMKTMNHIPAPRGGIVTRILIDDGAAVEYGAPLMIIE